MTRCYYYNYASRNSEYTLVIFAFTLKKKRTASVSVPKKKKTFAKYHIIKCFFIF